MNIAQELTQGNWDIDSWRRYDQKLTFADLKGMTLLAIKQLGSELRLITEDGRKFKLYHAQDCCESVWLEDICGDLDDLIGSPLLEAEQAVNSDGHWDDSPYSKVMRTQALIEDLPEKEYSADSTTWTFYKLGTNKGCVTLRWCGNSNGYYSESVDFVEITEEED